MSIRKNFEHFLREYKSSYGSFFELLFFYQNPNKIEFPLYDYFRKIPIKTPIFSNLCILNPNEPCLFDLESILSILNEGESFEIESTQIICPLCGKLIPLNSFTLDLSLLNMIIELKTEFDDDSSKYLISMKKNGEWKTKKGAFYRSRLNTNMTQNLEIEALNLSQEEEIEYKKEFVFYIKYDTNFLYLCSFYCEGTVQKLEEYKMFLNDKESPFLYLQNYNFAYFLEATSGKEEIKLIIQTDAGTIYMLKNSFSNTNKELFFKKIWSFPFRLVESEIFLDENRIYVIGGKNSRQQILSKFWILEFEEDSNFYVECISMKTYNFPNVKSHIKTIFLREQSKIYVFDSFDLKFDIIDLQKMKIESKNLELVGLKLEEKFNFLYNENTNCFIIFDQNYFIEASLKDDNKINFRKLASDSLLKLENAIPDSVICDGSSIIFVDTEKIIKRNKSLLSKKRIS